MDVKVTAAARIVVLFACVFHGLCHAQDTSSRTAENKPGERIGARQDLSKRTCPIGTGLREETAPILLKYKEHPGMVMSPTTELAAQVFPKLKGWVRVLGSPSLDGLRQKAQKARDERIPYEALGYGLETGKSTPELEWHDLVGSTQQARDIAQQFHKLLLMGPGFRLMSQNTDKYAPMSALSELWVFQTQRFQIDPPGDKYRQNVAAVLKQIRAGNPKIKIWAQITLPPDREPNAEEWLAYHRCIADLVDGTYVGAYTWRTEGEQLPKVIEAIFADVYGGSKLH